MAISDVLKRAVRTFQSSRTVHELVQGRIYAGDLPTIRNPVFPCITLSQRFSSQDSTDRMVSSVQYRVGCWSEEGYDECEDIYKALDTAFNEQGTTIDGRSVHTKVIVAIEPIFDVEDRKYAYFSIWEIRS